jgi:predicted Zn-dependent peptidase
MQLDFQTTRLNNGVRVMSVRMPQVESVAMGVWVGVGGRHENGRMSGVSHFIEHLLFKGTQTRSAKSISEAIEGRGGYFNAFTQEESTCYYARIADEHTWRVFAILADMYNHPRFDAGDIEKERGVILEEIMMYRDQPQHVAQENLGALLWADHSLGRPLIGTMENVRRFSRRDLLDFKKTHYAPACTLVALAGNVRHEECVAKVGALLDRPDGGRRPRCAPVGANTLQHRVSIVTKDIEQTHAAMGVRLFGRHDPRRYPLKLMSIILGENMSSRLFQIVRERYGLAYSISCSLEMYDETGVLSIHAGVDRKRKMQALDLIVGELRRMKNEPVKASELRRAKDYAIGQLRIGLESATNRMMWAGENMMCYGRFVQPGEVIDRIRKVTTEDIQNVARETLKARRFSAALVCPHGDAPTESSIRSLLKAL